MQSCRKGYGHGLTKMSPISLKIDHRLLKKQILFEFNDNTKHKVVPVPLSCGAPQMNFVFSDEN